MTTQFNAMMCNVLAHITDREIIPANSFHISTMSVSQGGLGLIDPRSSSIPTLMLQIRKCIQYSQTGVRVSQTQPNVPLRPNV